MTLQEMAAMNTRHFTGILCALLLGSAAAHAQEPIIYPAQGQSADQQALDRNECLAWAQQNTGFNPANVPQTASAPVPKQRGGRARGAAGGAIAGALIGDGNAKAGAAAGAVFGGLRQRSANASMEQQAQYQQQQAHAEYEAGLQRYHQAFGVCMQGRGYTVS
jgi:uncharacterized protein YcfJ